MFVRYHSGLDSFVALDGDGMGRSFETDHGGDVYNVGCSDCFAADRTVFRERMPWKRRYKASWRRGAVSWDGKGAVGFLDGMLIGRGLSFPDRNGISKKKRSVSLRPLYRSFGIRDAFLNRTG